MSRSKKPAKSGKTIDQVIPDQTIHGVNAVKLGSEMTEDINELGDDLTKLVELGASVAILETSAKEKFINLIAEMVTVKMAPLFTKQGQLRAGVPPIFLQSIFEWGLGHMNDKVRAVAQRDHDQAMERGEKRTKDKTATGKSATKSVRNKRRSLQDLCVSLTCGVHHIVRDALDACANWEPGLPGQMSWKGRHDIFMQGVEYLIEQESLPIMVGISGDEGPFGGRPYYLGMKNEDALKVGEIIERSFGSGKHEYTLHLRTEMMESHVLYTTLRQFQAICKRYETRCDGDMRDMRDYTTPPEFRVELIDTRVDTGK